ncbi:unnamed protein product [Staurois parvus]|uniref:Uncharacterized protein n=1 Tax=Staurois parvus TaxID=386267 RepID=A0ABN9F3T3_9NEOB|nr:unnamed protein product [Staurois parvus]
MHPIHSRVSPAWRRMPGTLYRSWLRQEYGRNPFKDQDRVEKLLSERAQEAGSQRDTEPVD